MRPRQDKIIIVSELSPQNEGDMDTLKTMILQSKMGGADIVKLQVYDSLHLLGSDKKQFAEISKIELSEIKQYCDNIGIDLVTSVFDEERLNWILDSDLKYIKIASRTHRDNANLCEKIVQSGRTIFVSNGMNPDSFPFATAKNVSYLYCIPEYPALLENFHPTMLTQHPFVGFSDHTFGLSAAKVAVAFGARVIEKHFTLSKAMQSSVNRAHLGSMTYNELVQLRAFCDDFVRMGHDL